MKINTNFQKATRLRLLREACQLHVQHNKECMIGQGIDRHLFILYVLAKGNAISSPFLDAVFSQQWLLSTSHVGFSSTRKAVIRQLPTCTDLLNVDPEASWFGASFAPVAKAGYGKHFAVRELKLFRCVL